MSKIIAYAWASGLIEIHATCPEGALPVVCGEDAAVCEIMRNMAVNHRDGRLYVPGISEENSGDENVDILIEFSLTANATYKSKYKKDSTDE